MKKEILTERSLQTKQFFSDLLKHTEISMDIWIVKLIIPIVLIIVFSLSTAIVFRSSYNYMHNKNVTVNSLKDGHQRSVAFYSELRFLRTRIAFWEMNYGGGWSPVQDIHEMLKELKQIEAIGQAFDVKCEAAAQIAWMNLNNYCNCLENLTKSNEEAACTNSLMLAPFKDLIHQYSEAISNTVK